MLTLNRGQQESALLSMNDAIAANLSLIVDAASFTQKPAGSSKDEGVEVEHLTFAPQERAPSRTAYDLPPVVEAIRPVIFTAKPAQSRETCPSFHALLYLIESRLPEKGSRVSAFRPSPDDHLSFVVYAQRIRCLISRWSVKRSGFAIMSYESTCCLSLAAPHACHIALIVDGVGLHIPDLQMAF